MERAEDSRRFQLENDAMGEDHDFEFLLEEVTEKHFAKVNATAAFFGFLDELSPDVQKRILDTFANATGPKYLADIADDIRWLLSGDEKSANRRNVVRLVTKDSQTDRDK